MRKIINLEANLLTERTTLNQLLKMISTPALYKEIKLQSSLAKRSSIQVKNNNTAWNIIKRQVDHTFTSKDEATKNLIKSFSERKTNEAYRNAFLQHCGEDLSAFLIQKSAHDQHLQIAAIHAHIFNMPNKDRIPSETSIKKELAYAFLKDIFNKQRIPQTQQDLYKALQSYGIDVPTNITKTHSKAASHKTSDVNQFQQLIRQDQKGKFWKTIIPKLAEQAITELGFFPELAKRICARRDDPLSLTNTSGRSEILKKQNLKTILKKEKTI